MGEPSAVIRVMCVDDMPDVVHVLERLLNSEPGFLPVGSLLRADGLAGEAIRLRADVVLLDLSMPGKKSLDAVRELCKASSSCRVIVYSGSIDDGDTDAAFEAGAWGVISRQAGFDMMLAAIRRVMKGEFVTPDSIA